MPNVFPGYQKVDERGCALSSRRMGSDAADDTGKDNHQMIDGILEGSFKALYIKGEDTITSDSNANFVGEALRSLIS